MKPRRPANIISIDDIPSFGYIRVADILMLRLAGAINKPTISWNERAMRAARNYCQAWLISGRGRNSRIVLSRF